MPSDLERIEEKHQDGGTLYCFICKQNHHCDVVKLARALDEAKTRFRLIARWLVKTTALDDEIQGVLAYAEQAERTLAEVAGEPDPEREKA